MDAVGPLAVLCAAPLLAGGGTAAAAGTATVSTGTVALGAGALTFGTLVVTDPLDGVFTNDQATPLPDGLVGENPRESRGKRKNSGPLTPENGSTGNAEEDFGVLGGGTSQPAPEDKGYPEGTQVAPNGTSIRPGKDGEGPRIDIPANGSKPPETLHYPDPSSPPPEPRE